MEDKGLGEKINFNTLVFHERIEKPNIIQSNLSDEPNYKTDSRTIAIFDIDNDSKEEAIDKCGSYDSNGKIIPIIEEVESIGPNPTIEEVGPNPQVRRNIQDIEHDFMTKEQGRESFWGGCLKASKDGSNK
jgi:hypothetical protein